MAIPETTTKPVLSVRIDQEIIDRIDKLVAETGVHRADVIERALRIGLYDQEKFVKELQGNVTGPLLQLLMNEKFLNVVYALCGDEADPNQLKAVSNIRDRMRRKKAAGRLASE